MRRYTTPTLPLTVPLDITAADICVTLKQGSYELEKTNDDVTMSYDPETGKTTLVVTLTQEETGAFTAEKKATVQVNWIFSDGSRDASNARRIDIVENLKDEVMTYGS